VGVSDKAVCLAAACNRLPYAFLQVPNPSKGATMKKMLIRLILAATVLLAMSATTAMADGGGIPPLCWPPRTGCVNQ